MDDGSLNINDFWQFEAETEHKQSERNVGVSITLGQFRQLVNENGSYAEEIESQHVLTIVLQYL